MGTVRSFVNLFAGRYFRSKPDRNADSFELRRLSTYASRDVQEALDAVKSIPFYPKDTVFYEYYWAFHYRDTSISSVVRWSFGAIQGFFRTRQWAAVRGQVRLVLVAWLTVLLFSITIVAWGAIDLLTKGASANWALLKLLGGPALTVVLWLVRPVFLRWIGDAARYFGTSPDNPVERQQIRGEGIKILQRLHEQEVNQPANPAPRPTYEYDRIIVVGHSLGSVVAYDLLTNYWAQVSQSLHIPAISNGLTIAMNVGGGRCPTAAPGEWISPRGDAAHWQSVQTDLIRETSAIPNINAAWRITDLVTLGSPLTYARFLLAADGFDLAHRQAQRELPTCPPTEDEFPDHHGLKSFLFRYDPVVPPDRLLPSSSAPFLLTRWTNIYLAADPIGGPVAPIFGWGIRDVPADFKGNAVHPHPDRRTLLYRVIDLFGGSHVRYWETLKTDPLIPLSPQCASELRWIVQRAPAGEVQSPSSI